ncbi:unnamed protein product, partial [Hapterophycus canaliculatus]
AAVAVETPTSQAYVRERALRALQMAAVSGFCAGNGLPESCLGLCNAFREGVPWECMQVHPDIQPSLGALFFPSAMEGWNAEGEPTRVLLPRRVRKVLWTFRPSDENEEPEAAVRLAGDRAMFRQSEEDYKEAPSALSDPVGIGKADLRLVQWPEGIEDIQLLLYDRQIQGVAWPSGLEQLSFHAHGYVRTAPWSTRGIFDHSLDGVSFPSSLRAIFLGERFNQPLVDVVWPDGLERLSLPGYRRSIDNVRWPPALKSLEFMPPGEIRLRMTPNVHAEMLEISRTGFNSRFTTLPASLETLWLSDGFEQSLDDVIWPSGLSTLGLGVGCLPSLMSGVSWPSSLRQLYSIYDIDDAESIPEGCTVSVVRDYDTESQSFDLDFDDRYRDSDNPLGNDSSDDCFDSDDSESYDSPAM